MRDNATYTTLIFILERSYKDPANSLHVGELHLSQYKTILVSKLIGISLVIDDTIVPCREQ